VGGEKRGGGRGGGEGVVLLAHYSFPSSPLSLLLPLRGRLVVECVPDREEEREKGEKGGKNPKKRKISPPFRARAGVELAALRSAESQD